MLYEHVEYIAVKFDYSDGWFNKIKAMIRQIKQKQWLKNEKKAIFLKQTYLSVAKHIY